MQQDSLGNHVLGTYFSLRIGIALLAAAFPFLLWKGGEWYVGLPLQNSMSAYYHASVDGKSMRDWFVGILFAIGVFLYLYKGYSKKENTMLNFAGIFAIGIAVFPIEWACGENCSCISLHGFCAVSFFCCIAYVCVRCAPETLHLIQNEKVKRRFRRLYKILAILMISSPVIAFVLNVLADQEEAQTFYIEAFGIIIFSLYWLTKSRELTITQAEKRSLQGKI